jgi:trimethylamine--corrinoid protein Co-methyltransferase
MRTAMLLTEVSDRDPRAQWIERGSLDSHARALQKAKDILTRPNPAVLPPDVDARVRAAFPGMVAGDSVPPEGWKRVAAEEDEDLSGVRRRRQRQLRAAA